MSVEHGGGSTEDQRTDDPWPDDGRQVRDAGGHVFAHLYESYAASLFDYCDGLLLDTIAAADAVQDSLIAVDAHIDSVPEPDRLRLSLYSAAHRQCLSKLAGGQGRLSGRARTATLDELGAAVPEFEASGAGGETVLVLRAALEWLADRDREVLNLTFRHRFGGADLAAVLGSSSRRAHALLSGARTRFEQSAPVVAVLRAAVRHGRPRCRVLAGMLPSRDLASLPLTPQLGKQFARHLEACPDCALSRGDRAFAAGQISEIPLAIPPGRLRLRITRTALALGSYRGTVAGRPGKPGQGGPPAPPRDTPGRHAGGKAALP
jgi:RNA polymerase sigma factor (sigma-70 family)